MVMQNLVNFIFLSLSSAIINVVPILYGMFKVLSNIQIVDYNDSSNIIFNVWNNLYILLSVLILFAIAIKLVNAIVNPDVLTDNKKGVKKAFFNALISVFLVVLLPFVFRGFHEIQSHILNNDIIPKFVFQSETQEDGGNMLAWMAISSTIDLEAFDEIDLIGDLDLVEYGDGTGIYIPADPEEHDPKWLLTELCILRPWTNSVIQAGIDAYLDIHPVVLFIFLVATIYELLILVLDTALRTFKLLLLEMMTPIVLGAYVFKSEILKSWALEYIKTFLQIFLLVLALCFMEYMVPLVSGLLQIDGIFHMPSTFLIIGVFRLLLYIGLLRLVKQIGPLINKIFGTNIQAKGGIKGRLGEMAAVGGLAQKAWSSLGGTAKGIGMTALGGAAGLIGAGARRGFDAVANGNGEAAKVANKIRDTYSKLKNGTVGAVAKTAAAGIKTKGNGTLKTMKDTWDKQPITASRAQQRINDRNARINEAHNMNNSGTSSLYRNGDAIASYVDENGNVRQTDINNSFQKDEKRARGRNESVEAYNQYLRSYNQSQVRKARARDEQRKQNAERDIESIVGGTRDYNPQFTSSRVRNYAKQKGDYERQNIAKGYMDSWIADLSDAITNTPQGSKDREALTSLKSKMLSPNFYKNADGSQKSTDELTAAVDAAIKARGLDSYFGNYSYSKGNFAQFAVATEGLDPGVDRNQKALGDRVGKDGSLTKEVSDIRVVLDKGIDAISDPVEKERILADLRDIDTKSVELAKDSVHLDFLKTQSGRQSIYDAPVRPDGGNYTDPYVAPAPAPAPTPAPAPAPTQTQTPAPTPTQTPQQDFGEAPDYWGNPNVVGTGPTPMGTPVVPELNAQSDTPIVNVNIHSDQPNLTPPASTKTETIITNHNTEIHETETSEKKQESSSSDKSEPVTVKVESEETSAADILAKALDRNTNTMNKMGKEMNNLADSVSEKPKDKNE